MIKPVNSRATCTLVTFLVYTVCSDNATQGGGERRQDGARNSLFLFEVTRCSSQGLLFLFSGLRVYLAL